MATRLGLFGTPWRPRTATNKALTVEPGPAAIDTSTPFVLHPEDGAVLVSANPAILEGGFLSAISCNVSLWILNSSAPVANLTPSDWSNRILFFSGREDGRRLTSSGVSLILGLTASLGGTGASATIEYTNRSVV